MQALQICGGGYQAAQAEAGSPHLERLEATGRFAPAFQGGQTIDRCRNRFLGFETSRAQVNQPRR